MHTPPLWRGRWKIIAMELWDEAYLNLVVPAHISFDDEAQGNFQFGAVEGGLDCRFSEPDGRARVDFSWEGFDDADSSSGRGWAELAPDGQLNGRLYIHNGDDSAFHATRDVRNATKSHPKARRK
jgi:hypothetical protein